jgi:dimethylargininase
MFTRAIVRPPAANFAEGLTTADLGTPDYERALKQHEAYCRALEQCGLTLTRLETDPLHPDSAFVEDTAVLTDKCAVLTRPGAPSRVGEVVSIKKVLTDFYSDMLSIQPPGTVDGGDVCEAGEHFFIGISERTNEAGARQLADLLMPFGYTTSFVDIRGLNDMKSVPRAVATGSVSAGILHLKSGLACLDDNRLVVIDELTHRAEFAKYGLVRVNHEETYAANCVQVNDHVLVAAGFPDLEGKLGARGYQTIALDMSEFQKMDGGLSCLSLRF